MSLLLFQSSLTFFQTILVRGFRLCRCTVCKWLSSLGELWQLLVLVWKILKSKAEYPVLACSQLLVWNFLQIVVPVPHLSHSFFTSLLLLISDAFLLQDTFSLQGGMPGSLRQRFHCKRYQLRIHVGGFFLIFFIFYLFFPSVTVLQHFLEVALSKYIEWETCMYFQVSTTKLETFKDPANT